MSFVGAAMTSFTLCCLFAFVGVVTAAKGEGSYTFPAEGVTGAELTLDELLPVPPTEMPQLLDIGVRCFPAKNSMVVTASFHPAFNGVVYPVGFFRSKACRRSITDGSITSMDIPLNACGTIKTLQGEGNRTRELYTNTLVMMQSPELGILEEWDHAYQLSCAMLPPEARMRVQTLHFGLGLPALPDTIEARQEKKQQQQTNTNTVATVTPTPKCYLQIIAGSTSLEGQGAEQLTVGQVATLVFYTDAHSNFDVSVTSCYANDGMQMSNLHLLDSDGCPVHRKYIGLQQRYRDEATATNFVFINFKVFKFPDAGMLYFDCQCAVCKDTCEQPTCPETTSRRKRALHDNDATTVLPPTAAESATAAPSNVTVNEVYDAIKVRLPGEKSAHDTRAALLRDYVTHSSGVCVNRSHVIAIVSIVAAVSLLAVTTVAVLPRCSRIIKRHLADANADMKLKRALAIHVKSHVPAAIERFEA